MIPGSWLPLMAVAAAMLVQDIFGSLVTASVAHGRSTLAANFDCLCDLGKYLVPAVGIEVAGGLHWQTIFAVACGGWVGTKAGTWLSVWLESWFGRRVPHHLTDLAPA